MSRRKLSPVQVFALASLEDGPILYAFGGVFFGHQWRKTTGILESRGLIRFMPYAAGGRGAWRITPHGRKVLDTLT